MHQFVSGQRRAPASADATFDVVDPDTGETVALAGPADVDAVVSAARHAFTGWSRAAPVERSAAGLTGTVRPGDPFDERTDRSADVRRRQERVAGFVLGARATREIRAGCAAARKDRHRTVFDNEPHHSPGGAGT